MASYGTTSPPFFNLRIRRKRCENKKKSAYSSMKDGANEPQQEQQPASVRQEYHLTFSEEETERWKDAEEEEGLGEHGEEQPEWDFTDLRRSSNISSNIRGFRAAQKQVGKRHAMAAQIKFQSPTTFGGKDGENVLQWMHRYERIGRYNRWGDDGLHDHVELSLSGAAQKWYSYKEAAGQLTAEWVDDAGPPIVPGVKTQLLEQFKPVKQNRFNEAKLRERKQGIEESTIEYFYEILDSCRRVDPNVTETTKLAHLWRGLKPSLLEKLWSLKPSSCDEFLQEIKRYQEMTSRARHEEWVMGVVGKQTPTTGSERMDRIEKLLEGLMGVVASRNASGAAAQQGERAESQQYRSDNQSILKWTSEDLSAADDTYVATARAPSKKEGHHNNNSNSRCDSLERFRKVIGLVGTQHVDPGLLAWPILKIDIQRMVVLDVLCWGKRVAAVIDTGAGVSVCSSKLVRELGITVTPWRANRLVSVGGKEIQPGGAAMLSVSDGRMTVEGEALVLDGDIDLLLGKDMLEKLGRRMKIGALPEIFIGDIAIGALMEEMMEEAPKLVVQKGCWVPPRSRKVVATQPLDSKGFGKYALVEPSQALQRTKRVSTGKVMVSGVGTIGQMAITNLSDHKQWIEEGTVLGIIEPVTEIKEGDTPVAVATAGAEKKAHREHEFESRIGEGLMPTDRAHYPNNELKHEEKWKSATISSDDEIENYLNLCDSLDKLSFYRIIQQMYKRYNVTLPSSASVERLFSQGGLIFSPRRLNLTDIHFEMLLFLKVNNKIVKDS
ncbi:Uncharacterized protein APZ42_025350 [Daphnia magna]|uniref:Peptidase A2 domain-containing protein n=1 Tax=Daphnia magna TaxID=35525 RepID=A0A164T7E2_9CRUS|nr:Uncharacterized protein APZ42_025350 [Daphnia magna]